LTRSGVVVAEGHAFGPEPGLASFLLYNLVDFPTYELFEPEMRTWVLPEYIEDILPAEAARIERLRRDILDLFAVHGFELVMPPLIEYLESLLTGTGHDLDLQTFKLVDQLSGRMLGVRADIAPQAARIDAHLLNRKGITRLCYTGSVLHTLPRGMNRTREPLQVGAELYGHAGIESDVEVQRLMMKGLALAGIRESFLDIGHVGIFRCLVGRAGLDAERESELFRAMQSKDVPGLKALTRKAEPRTAAALVALPQLYGGPEVIAAAKKSLPDHAEIRAALADLQALSAQLSDVARIRCFDLAELRGYHYHSGVVFAAYAGGAANAVALGGRYDEVGQAFVRARGVVVVVDLPGHAGTRAELGCDQRLAKRNGKWQVLKSRSN
jgi:ATP phosphoribosyltransferase regulatory subunit